MYLNKLSSGSVLALLALSGVLLLVPIAAPAHASMNASPPTISLSNNLVVNQLGSGETITIANPATNAYAIQAITVSAPAGWNFSAAGDPTVTCPGGFALSATSLTAFSCTGGSLLPGFSGQVSITGTLTHGGGSTGIQGPSVSATSSPVSGVFTTSLIDGGSAPAAYVGPSFTLWSIAAQSTVTSVTSSSANFVAGSSPVTITAQLSSTEPNVPVTWSVAAGTTAAGTLSSTTTDTSSTGAATVTYTPSNLAGTATVTATVAYKPAGSPSNNVVETTVAAAPSTVTITFTAAPHTIPSTHWIENNFATVGTTNYANIPASTLSFAVTDLYTNPVSGIVAGTPETVFTATNGFWNLTPGTLVTAAIPAANGAITDSYQQSGVFGTVGLITATFTGTWMPPTGPNQQISVSGSTGNLETSLLNTAAPGFTLTTNGVTAIANPVGAGKFIVPQLVLVTAQAGVPVTINVCGHAETGCGATTKGQTGTFASNGLMTITVNTVTSTTAPVSGNASAHFNIDTTLGHSAMFNATVLAPIDGTPKNNVPSGPIGPVTTGAGSAAQFKVAVTLTNGPAAGNDGPTVTNVVAGGTAYVDIYTADKYGNIVTTGLAQQTQINLAATAGSLSVTSAYIPANCYETNGTLGSGCTSGNGFGTISWTVSSTVGTVQTLTVSGVLGGVPVSTSVSETSVSPLPTISVTSPTPQTINGASVIPSSSSAVIFTGAAAVSVGYPTSTNINSIGYKIGSASWQSAAITAGNSITWSVAATAPTGLSTIQFNATDAKKNVATTQTYTVLVDSTPPTFTFAAATSNTGCLGVTIATAEGDFNTATFAATYGTTTIPSSSITWTGTQTLGTAGSITANVCGLTTNTQTFTVSGSTYTGVSATNSETLTVTVPYADSITFGSSATYSLTAGATGLTVSVTNSWSSSQNLYLTATLVSGTTRYVLTTNLVLASGQTDSSALIAVQPGQAVPAGTYTVTFSAVDTGTTPVTPVSAPTTPITVVVP